MFKDKGAINLNLASDKDCSLGGALPSGADLIAGMIVSEISETLPNPKHVPSTKSIEKFIANFIPEHAQSISALMDIQDDLNTLVKQVRANCKSNEESIPSFAAAVDILNRMSESGLIEASRITVGGNTVIEKASQILKEEDSIRERLGTFQPAPATEATSVVKLNAAPSSEATPASFEPQPSSGQEITLFRNLGAIAGVSGEKFGQIIIKAGLNESDIADLTYFATGYDGKLDSNGELIIRKESPSKASLAGMLALLDDGYSKELVLVMAELKRLMDVNDEVVFTDLLEDEILQSLTENDFNRLQYSKGVLEPEVIEAFCTEFGYDLGQVNVHEVVEKSKILRAVESTDSNAAEEIAEGLLTAIKYGSGETFEARIKSFIETSQAQTYLTGDLRAISELFENSVK